MRVFTNTFWNRANTILILVLTFVSTYCAIKVMQDDRQVKDLNSLVIGQQAQLDNGANEIKKLDTQIQVALQQSKEMSGIDSQLTTEAVTIGKQLKISQLQQGFQNRILAMNRKINVNKIWILFREMSKIWPHQGLIAFKDSLQKQVHFLTRLKSLLEEGMVNPILLEEDSLFSKWLNIHEWITLTNTFITTPKTEVEILQETKNGIIRDTTVNSFTLERQNEFDFFAKKYLNFFFYLNKIIHKKIEEEKIKYD